MADEFTVIAWDEPEAGRSSAVPGEFDLADDADCLEALLETLAVGPAHIAGLSWGGTVVQELYRHHPGLFATMILVDTYAGWKGSLPTQEVYARVEGVLQMLAAPAEEFDPALPELFAGAPPAEFLPLLEEMAAAVRPKCVKTQLVGMAATDQRDLLPRISVPTLLIRGELDERSPLSVAHRFQQAIQTPRSSCLRAPVTSPTSKSPSNSTTPCDSSAAPTPRVTPDPNDWPPAPLQFQRATPRASKQQCRTFIQRTRSRTETRRER